MFTNYERVKSNKSVFALARGLKRSVILNFVPHESVRLGIMTFILAMELMDLVSLATIVGQSSTPEKGTVMKTRIHQCCIGLKGCSRNMSSYEGDNAKLHRHVSYSSRTLSRSQTKVTGVE